MNGPEQDPADQIMKRTVTVIIDESGNPGLNDSERIYLIGATILADTKVFGDISKMKREELKTNELKYRDAPRETKIEVLVQLDGAFHLVVCVYLDKTADDNPPWWLKYKNARGKQQLKMVEEIAKDLMEEDVDRLVIIIDDHSAYKESLASDILRRAADEAGKQWCYIEQEDSKTGDHKDLIQTNDILIGTIRKNIRDNKPLDARVKVRRVAHGREK